MSKKKIGKKARMVLGQRVVVYDIKKRFNTEHNLLPYCTFLLSLLDYYFQILFCSCVAEFCNMCCKMDLAVSMTEQSYV